MEILLIIISPVTVEKHNIQESFDVVIVNNVITHVEDVFDFLKALSSVTKKNGIIYFEMCDYQKVVECKRFDYFYHGDGYEKE